MAQQTPAAQASWRQIVWVCSNPAASRAARGGAIEVRLGGGGAGNTDWRGPPP